MSGGALNWRSTSVYALCTEMISQMRLEQLTIGGFGRLRGKHDLAAGLNLVSGANEAGKSTFHDAVVRSLFGFAPEERRRHEGTSVKDQRMPWAGAPFSLTLRALDHEGRAVVAVWDFVTEFAELHDALTGKVILREQPKQRADYDIGCQLVGMTREEFTQVCCLYQGAVETVRPSEGLHAALQRSVESAPAEDIGVQSADERLRKLLSNIGVHGGYYGALANGELDRASKREATLRAQLEEAREQRRALDGVAAKLDTARQRCVDGAERVLTLEQRMLRTAVASLKQRDTRALQLSAKRQDRPADGPTLTRELVGREQELRVRIAALDAREGELLSEIGAAATEAAEQEHGVTTAKQRITELAVHQGVDLADEEAVRALLADVRAAGAEDASRPLGEEPKRDSTLAQFRDQRDELIAQRAGQATKSWNAQMLGFALVLAVVGAAGAALVNPGLALVIVAGAICAWVARPRAVAMSDLVSLSAFGGRSFEELDDECAHEDRVLSESSAARDARKLTDAERLVRSQELHERLAAATPGRDNRRPAKDPVERAEAYLAACNGARALAQTTADLKQSQARLDVLSVPAARIAEVQEERAGPAAELSGLYRQAGLDADKSRTVGDEFAACAQRAQHDEGRIMRAEQASAALHELLDGRTMEELGQELGAAERALTEHERLHGEQPPGEASANEGEDGHELARAKSELTKCEIEVAELNTVVKEREGALLAPADLDVELVQVQARRERLELIRDAVRTARTALQKAAQETHRRVAPFLNDALQRELPRITRGRYTDGTIDEDLAIRLYAPESGRLVSIEQLSRGTRDQVALVQRLEIARLLDPTAGEAPLFLDDPFAHFDSARLRLGAELIAEVSNRRQVILFTEDAAVMERMQAACPGCNVIELRDPVTDTPAALTPDGLSA
jgi:hypothetical protein